MSIHFVVVFHFILSTISAMKSEITNRTNTMENETVGRVTRHLLRTSLGISLLNLPSYASAYTECTVLVSRIWVGDEGSVLIYYNNGGSAYVFGHDPDKEASLAVAMTALTGQRQITVRYTADGVTCTTPARTDVSGIYLN